jgi:ribosomal protein S18 acetylase RimI-like enzyme
MNIKIRLATSKDYQPLLRLYASFVRQPTRYQKLDNDSFHNVLENPNSFIYLATSHQRIVGFIAFSTRTVVRYPKPIVEIEEFYVVPELRRKGIGKQLMQPALDYSGHHGCQYIFLASSKDRLPAHKFYKSFKFDEYAFHYRRKP